MDQKTIPSGPPLQLAPPVRAPFCLPVPLDSFVGRAQETRRLLDLVQRESVRLVTLTGPGGIGKTRLALQVASLAADSFEDGCRFIDLTPVVDATLVAPAFATALGIRDVGDRVVAERVTAALAGQEVLIVVDNAERVLDSVPFLIELLQVAPRCKMIVTSRIRLHARGEHLLVVPPLALSGPGRDPAIEAVDTAEMSEAVHLFVERAQASHADFTINDENAVAVSEICRRLEGVPLAIELAAAWAAYLPPRLILDRLDPQLPSLIDGPRDAPERQRTMQDTIAWGYGLLSTDDRMLVRRLSVFPDGFGLEAAQALAGPELDALSGIKSLVDASMLQRRDRDGQELRFVMLETIREFGLDRLADAEEHQLIFDRQAGWSLDLAERGFSALVLEESVDLAWLDRLDREHANLQDALARLESAGDGRFIRLAGILGPFWFFRSHLSVGAYWLERALPRLEGEPNASRAMVLMSLGVLLEILGQEQRAADMVSHAAMLWECEGETFLAAQARTALAWMQNRMGAYREAKTNLDWASTCFSDMDKAWWLAKVDFHRGEAALGSGERETAQSYFAQALDRYRHIADGWGTASAHMGLAEIARIESRHAVAARHLQEAYLAWQVVGTPEGLVVWLANAVVVIASRNQRMAARLFGAVELAAQRLSVAFGMPDRTRFAAAENAMQAVLGRTRFESELDAGRAITLEHAADAAAGILESLATPPSRANGRADERLTQREWDVLLLVAAGATDREIGQELSISQRTVGVHISHILAKLGVESRRAARVLAVHNGWAPAAVYVPVEHSNQKASGEDT